MTYVGAPYAYGITQIAFGLRAVVAARGGGDRQRGDLARGANILGLQRQRAAGAVRCGDWFYSLLNRDMVGRVFGSPNPAFSEFWWDWPDERCHRVQPVSGVQLRGPRQAVDDRQRTRTAAIHRGNGFPVLGGALQTA